MARKRTRDATYIIAFVAMIMFAVSVALTIIAGVSPGIALIWNVLASLYISYSLIPNSMLANPLIFTSSLLDSLVFALFAVFLATWFIDLIRSINITEYLALSKVKRLKGHIIVAPYNDFARVLTNELLTSGFKFVVIAGSEVEAAYLYSRKMLAIVGEIRNEDSFKTAGIDRASYLIACEDDDVKNALIAISAKDANPNIKVISRVIEEENLQKLDKAGASWVVIPGVTAGKRVGDEIVKRMV